MGVKPSKGRLDQGGHKETQGHHHKKGLGDGGSKPPNVSGRQPLTMQMRMACFEFMACGDKTEAYKRAYNPDPAAKHTKKRAYELFKLPQVSEFLEELYENAREKHDINIDTITKNLLEDRALAFMSEDAKAAVAADLGIAKLHGLLVDRKKLLVAGSLEHNIRSAQQRAQQGRLNHLPTKDMMEDIEEAEYEEISSDD